MRPAFRRARGSLTLTAFLTIILILSSFQSPAAASLGRSTPPPPIPQAIAQAQGGIAPLQNASAAPAGFTAIGNVTLITGDEVVVYQGSNGTLRAGVIPALPKGHEKFGIINFGKDMYVIPAYVPLARFDLSLFDLRLLLNASSIDATRLPVIFQEPTRLGVKQMAAFMKSRGYESGTIQDSLRLSQASIGTSDRIRMHEAFLSLPRVTKAWLDETMKVQSIPWTGDANMAFVGAPYAWNHDYNGTGSTIAVLDSGIYAPHPDFYFPNGTSKIVGAVDFTDDGTTDDLLGHGTHVAGIAAGTGAASGGLYAGVAPGAALMNVKVIDRFGDGYDSWIISGIQWAVAHKATVISISFADGVTDGTDPVSQSVNWAEGQGVAVVVAAGNGGCFDCMETVEAPGAAAGAITVGASGKVSSPVPSFSGMGPTLDGRIKPDLVAPGIAIISARDPDGIYSRIFPPSDSSGYYMALTGTSTAAPHVAGAYTLLSQKYPGSDPAQIKDLLVSTADYFHPYAPWEDGGGVLNITAALTTQITVRPAELNLKLYGGTPTGVIAVKDVGSGPVNVTLIQDSLLSSPVVSLNASYLTLRPGQTAHVLVTAVPFQENSPSYARILMTYGNERVAQALIGVNDVLPLTMHKIDINGNRVTPSDPDPLADQVFVFKLSASSPYEEWTSSNSCWFNSTGACRMMVQAGTYEAVSMSTVDGGLVNFADAVLVSAPTSVTMDDRSTSPVTFDSGISSMNATASSMTVRTNSLPFGFFSMAGFMDFNGIGTFHVAASPYWAIGDGYQYFGPGTTPGSQAPDFYHLFFSSPTIAQGCCRYVANYSQTVDKNTLYKSEALSGWALRLSLAGGPLVSEQALVFYIFRAPMAEQEILSPDATYVGVYYPPGLGSYFLSVFGPEAPGSVQDVWAGAPLIPLAAGVNGIVSGMQETNLTIAFWSDPTSLPHFRCCYFSNYTLYNGGYIVFSGRGWTYYNPDTLSIQGLGTGRFELDGQATMYDTLSTYNRVLYQFGIASPGGPITSGPRFGRISAYALDSNDTEHVNPEVITFSVLNESDVKLVTAAYSTSTHVVVWHRANVTSLGGSTYSFKVNLPKSSMVSLNLTALDANQYWGNTIVDQGFAFSGGAPSVKVSCSRNSVMVLSTTRCTAHVTGVTGGVPTGKVSWTSAGLGYFSENSCNLKGGSCSVQFIPAGGNATAVVAHYGGDFFNPPSASRYNLTVLLKPTRPFLTCAPGKMKAGSTVLTCEFRVTGYYPTGYANLSQTGTGLVTFGETSCALTEGICYFTIGAVNPGAVWVRASYSGDSVNRHSFAVVKVRITR